MKYLFIALILIGCNEGMGTNQNIWEGQGDGAVSDCPPIDPCKRAGIALSGQAMWVADATDSTPGPAALLELRRRADAYSECVD